MDNKEKEKYLWAVGSHIQRIRKEKGFSYRQLAQRCDVDHSQISKIEKGLVSFEILTLLELARGLEVEPRVLLDIDFRGLS